MVCPYSLSIPGGVQAQVLGLARELRRPGHEVRVLGPCDGPPPEAFVTPLGDSLPTAANGSIAPLAPDPSASLRTFRALRDEQFDVIHVHEPLAPGPSITTVTLHYAPTVGTFHAAGRSTDVPGVPARAAPAARADRPEGGGVEGRARAGARSPRRRPVGVPRAVQRRRDRPRSGRRRRARSDRPAIFFLGRHEERKGLDVLLARAAAARARRVVLGGRGRARHRSAPGRARRRPAHRVARRIVRPGEGGAPAAARRCSAPRRCTASRSGWC